MAEWILAFSTLLGAGVYIVATLNIPSLFLGDVVGPRFFPELIGIGLVVSGLLLAYEAFQKRAVAAGVIGAPVAGVPKKAQKILAGMTLWTLAYYASFEPVGYIISTIIYIFCLLSYFHRVRWWHNAIYTLMFTAIAYSIFDKFLHVVLPSGILPI